MGQTIVTAPDGKKYRVTHPDGASNDEIQRQLQTNLDQADPPPQDDGSWQWGDIPRGLAKGALGDVRGAAQLSPSWVKTAARAIPGEASVESFAKAPSRSGLESGSEFVGAAAPFVAGELATGGVATPFLGAAAPIVEGALWSGLGSASQPTESGTLGSHLVEGAEGLATGGAMGVGGRVAQKLTPALAEKLARHAATHGQAGVLGTGMHAAGIPWWASGGPWFWWNQLHHSPLSNTAARWARMATPGVHAGGRFIEKAAPVSGVGVGQAQEDQLGWSVEYNQDGRQP